MNELFNLGHNIMHVPTLKITSANIEPVNIKNYNALVFTSSNAVKNLQVIGEKQNIKCFYIWGLGNILFMIYAFLISAPPQIAMSAFVLGMNVYGYYSWKKDI